MEFAFLEPLHHFTDVLRAVARAKENRVGCIDEHQVVDTDGGYEFIGTPEVVAVCVESEMLRS